MTSQPLSQTTNDQLNQDLGALVSQCLDTLKAAGLTVRDMRAINAKPQLAGLLMAALRDGLSSDPWMTPFVIIARRDWRNLDGTEPGDVQIRSFDGGVQTRVRRACGLPYNQGNRHANHDAETCFNCWTTPREFGPSDQWRPVTGRIQIKLPESHSTTAAPRVEVMRRLDPSAPVPPESTWSAAWHVPECTTTELYKRHSRNIQVDTTWVNVTDDVQVSRGHTFPRGVLVRRATQLEPVAEWTTPTFLPDSSGEWVDLVPDGSLQVRFWTKQPGSTTPAAIEARQHIGREVALAVEPYWQPSELLWNSSANVGGYHLQVEYRTGTRSWLSRHGDETGLRVTDPMGHVKIHLVKDHFIMVGPNLKVRLSSQGSMSIAQGTFEPPADATVWIMGTRCSIDTSWHTIRDTVRFRRELAGQNIDLQQFRQGRWASLGTCAYGSTYELTPDIRIHFGFDDYATVQFPAPAAQK